ncbi:hypothetical protein [Halobacterium litoreum]|uniref:Uncharacterized protein n=1 Tax=Halobacterium litoreum TaxID=2039234 RepID=A0ABD5NHF0_9EURY|nr:hypothetical protein [Halobacterium litoreum]UHH12411.1 hypothetical protein LT972_09600 [Halobacterium litoreum]
MVEANQTATGLSRLVTFETSEREQLLIRAGFSEVENRVLYQGDVTGRYAVVPVDELVGDEDRGDDVLGFDAEPQVEEMQIIGDAAHVGADGSEHVALYRGGEQVAEFDSKGAYGLLWIPYE